MGAQFQISASPSLQAAIRLLRTAKLPTEDLTPSHVEHFFYSGPAAQPTGLVGLEIFGDVALLRSLVVTPEYRGSGAGRKLLEHAEREAWARGVRAIYLLTTTAEPFFSKHGYSRTAREAAPAAIESTREYAGICPASSAFMSKRLSGLSKVTIHHNPACGTSRNTLGLIRNAGIEPTVVEYLVHPPTREELVAMIEAAGITVRQSLRQKGTPYAELGLDNEELSDDDLLDAMLRHPVLINRPFVITEVGTRLCRPSEAVLEILPQPQRGYFAKEAGEVVINERGERVAR